MTKVSFRLSFTTAGSAAVGLPIEIRKPNMVLVGRTFSSQAVDLAPGSYYVTVHLPGGQEYSERIHFDVAKPGGLVIELSPDPETQPEERDPNQFSLSRPRAVGPPDRARKPLSRRRSGRKRRTPNCACSPATRSSARPAGPTSTCCAQTVSRSHACV
jgi:hypothetical protein